MYDLWIFDMSQFVIDLIVDLNMLIVARAQLGFLLL